MSLGYDIAQVLPELRAEAESRMTDACVITRPVERVFDEDTGEWVEDIVTVYSGKCRVKSPATAARSVDAGSQLVVVSAPAIHVPVSAEGIRVGDVATVTASATRPAMVGRVFTIAAPFDGAQTTAQRFQVEASDGR